MLYPDVNMLRIFCLLGHGWGWQPLKGGCRDYNPPSLDNIVTYSVYIIIEVMYFVYISHILPHTWLAIRAKNVMWGDSAVNALHIWVA